MKRIHYALLGGMVLVIGGIAIASFNPKRPMATDYVRIPSHAIAITQETKLKEVIDPEMSAHLGQSGFELLIKGDEALSRLIATIQVAERKRDPIRARTGASGAPNQASASDADDARPSRQHSQVGFGAGGEFVFRNESEVLAGQDASEA